MVGNVTAHLMEVQYWKKEQTLIAIEMCSYLPNGRNGKEHRGGWPPKTFQLWKLNRNKIHIPLLPVLHSWPLGWSYHKLPLWRTGSFSWPRCWLPCRCNSQSLRAAPAWWSGYGQPWCQCSHLVLNQWAPHFSAIPPRRRMLTLQVIWKTTKNTFLKKIRRWAILMWGKESNSNDFPPLFIPCLIPFN